VAAAPGYTKAAALGWQESVARAAPRSTAAGSGARSAVCRWRAQREAAARPLPRAVRMRSSRVGRRRGKRHQRGRHRLRHRWRRVPTCGKQKALGGRGEAAEAQGGGNARGTLCRGVQDGGAVHSTAGTSHTRRHRGTRLGALLPLWRHTLSRSQSLYIPPPGRQNPRECARRRGVGPRPNDATSRGGGATQQPQPTTPATKATR